MLKSLPDFYFTFRKPAVCSILISQDFCKGLNFVPDSFSMNNSVSPRITSGGCFYSQPECFSDILFCGFYDRFQSLIIITPVSQKISHCNQSRNPDCIALCQHGKAFFIHIVSMLQTVHSGSHRCLYSVISVGMGHDSHTFLMCNMYHFLYL